MFLTWLCIHSILGDKQKWTAIAARRLKCRAALHQRRSPITASCVIGMHYIHVNNCQDFFIIQRSGLTYLNEVKVRRSNRPCMGGINHTLVNGYGVNTKKGFINRQRSLIIANIGLLQNSCWMFINRGIVDRKLVKIVVAWELSIARILHLR